MQCARCGAPRWDGPGWQLQQRLAAALQAGAALSTALLPARGSDAPAAVAAAAAQAALARLRREAAAGAAAAGGSGGGRAGGGDSSDDEEAAVAAAAAAAGLPSFEQGDEFRSLAEMAGDMLAESSESQPAGPLHLHARLPARLPALTVSCGLRVPPAAAVAAKCSG